MKQHITSSQLNELSDKGKEKLRKWWKPALHDFIVSEWKGNKIASLIQNLDYSFEAELIAIQTYGFKDIEKKYSLPLLSIGQMIEFLQRGEGEGKFKDGWYLQYRLFGWVINDREGNEKELADSLWEACKEVLNG